LRTRWEITERWLPFLSFSFSCSWRVWLSCLFLFQPLYWRLSRPGVERSDGCATIHSLHLVSPSSTTSQSTSCVRYVILRAVRVCDGQRDVRSLTSYSTWPLRHPAPPYRFSQPTARVTQQNETVSNERSAPIFKIEVFEKSACSISSLKYHEIAQMELYVVQRSTIRLRDCRS